MRIGLRIFSNPAWMGGVHYVLNIARMLRALPADEQPQIVFLPPTPAAEEIAARNADLADAVVPFVDAAGQDLDFVYPATQLAEAPFGAPWAGWIPDWQSIHLPQMFAERELNRRFVQYRVLAQRCAGAVLSSRMALDDTRTVFDDATADLHILHFPAMFDAEVYDRSPGRLAATRARLGVPERYGLICNQFWLHKNHLAAIEALRHVHGDVHLVMTGELDDKRWPDYAAQIREVLADPDVARRVTLTESIARDDQIDLMLGALAFVQPSLFEGWSTFVEEARALGRPALLSDFPVHREQAPPGSDFFDAHDPKALAARLDAWFAEPPPGLPLDEARARHHAYVLACARDFIAIARAVRDAFRPDLHDPKAVAVAALLELHEDVAAGRHGLGPDDEALFQAAVRQLLRDYPEELAGFDAMVADPAHPLHRIGRKLIVDATAAKLDEAARDRFNRARAHDETEAPAR